MCFRELLRNLFAKEQIVQRAERSVFLHLIHGHLLAVNSQLNVAPPAVKLMRSDFADIPRITIWTSHVYSPYPLTECVALNPGALR